ncbi:uncharacterized protein CDAR_536391 [Caerostris darwini]|uniref:DDE-1 domain-containing protein n=1 Tax=Caerostris darwini TaxID=1538125 RepID=A0AAV4WCB7_9ARAC|nr:uncharacterized protein CDAR_536391 [Caerostris darwini]
MHTCTDSGLMEDIVFENWINNFAKYVQHLQKPVLLIFNGYGNYLTYEAIKHAIKEIIILCLPPKTSNIQPLECLFLTFEKKWRHTLKEYFKENNNREVTNDFPLLLDKLLEGLSQSDIINSFKLSAIYPPDHKAATLRLISSDIVDDSVNTSNVSHVAESKESMMHDKSPVESTVPPILNSERISPKLVHNPINDDFNLAHSLAKISKPLGLGQKCILNSH